jgi:hypothetical protein
MLIWSGKIVHPPIIERETFHKVQAMTGGRATAPAGHKPHRRQHPYALRGLVTCGICGRISGARWGLAGAEAVLKLRALLDNGDFDAYWRCHLTREHQRVHPAPQQDEYHLTA